MAPQHSLQKSQIEQAFIESVKSVSDFAKEAIADNRDEFFKSNLIDYGINSIDYCAIVFLTLEKFGVTPPPVDLFSSTNRMDEIVDIFSRLIENVPPDKRH